MMAFRPCNWAKAARVARGQVAAVRGARQLLLDQVDDHLAVGLGAEAVAERAPGARAAVAKFSTMPLWMSASVPVESKWGWALARGDGAVGGPAGVAEAGGGVGQGDGGRADLADLLVVGERAVAARTATPHES